MCELSPATVFQRRKTSDLFGVSFKDFADGMSRFAFRNPASKLQFTIEFPHDKHQDVIASAATPRSRSRSHMRHRRTTTTARSATRHALQRSRQLQRITRRVSTAIGNRSNQSPRTATDVINARQLPTCRPISRPESQRSSFTKAAVRRNNTLRSARLAISTSRKQRRCEV